MLSLLRWTLLKLVKAIELNKKTQSRPDHSTNKNSFVCKPILAHLNLCVVRQFLIIVNLSEERFVWMNSRYFCGIIYQQMKSVDGNNNNNIQHKKRTMARWFGGETFFEESCWEMMVFYWKILWFVLKFIIIAQLNMFKNVCFTKKFILTFFENKRVLLSRLVTFMSPEFTT